MEAKCSSETSVDFDYMALHPGIQNSSSNRDELKPDVVQLEGQRIGVSIFRNQLKNAALGE
jgi:hypothetical protein